jgi:hypothetical protein
LSVILTILREVVFQDPLKSTRRIVFFQSNANRDFPGGGNLNAKNTLLLLASTEVALSK